MIFTLWHTILQEWFVFDRKAIEIDRKRDCGNVKLIFRGMRRDRLNIIRLSPYKVTHAPVPDWWKFAQARPEIEQGFDEVVPRGTLDQLEEQGNMPRYPCI